MGLDLGLERAGWHCVFANEFDRVACRTIRHNRPDLKLLEGDIRDVSPSDITQPIDLVVGGPPCQAFSTAGKRLGLNDERGNVFLKFIDLAISLQPKVVLIENVRGLLSAPLRHRPHAERGFGFDPLAPDELPGGAFAHITAVLKSAGYSVSHDLLDASEFGVPQVRKRVVILASRLGRLDLPDPTHGGRLQPLVTFRDAVQGLSPHQDFVRLRDKQSEVLKHLGPGQNWRDLPRSMQSQALGKAFECTGGRTGFYRRIAWDEPCPTLMTSPTMPATLLGHPVEDRPLSVQEYARVQTFPDDWAFEGTVAQKYRQIGNAVPVLLGKAIGDHLKRHLAKDLRGVA